MAHKSQAGKHARARLLADQVAEREAMKNGLVSTDSSGNDETPEQTPEENTKQVSPEPEAVAETAEPTTAGSDETSPDGPAATDTADADANPDENVSPTSEPDDDSEE